MPPENPTPAEQNTPTPGDSSPDPAVSDDEANFQSALSEALSAPRDPSELDAFAPKEEKPADGEADEPNPDAPPASSDPAPTEAQKAEKAEKAAKGEDEDGSDDEEGSDDDDAEERLDAELDKLPQAQLDRNMRKTIRQRAKFRDERNALRTERDEMARALGLRDSGQLSPQVLQRAASEAQGFRDLSTFMQQANLESQDVNRGMEAMAAVTQGNWAKFKEIVGPYWDMMSQATGEGVPKDLQQLVDQGEMSENVAAQYAQDRVARQQAEIQARRASAQANTLNQQVQQNTQAQRQMVSDQIRNEVNRWQQETARSDPDFGRKASLIQDRVAARIAQQGSPQDTRTALDWAKEAHAHVTRTLGSAQSQTRSQPVTPIASPTSTTVRPQQAATIEETLLRALE